MAATWNISNLRRQVSFDGKADVVTSLDWQVTELETVGSVEHVGKVYGSIGLDTSDLSSFIAYADITEADAIAWAKAALGADQVAENEKSVANQILKSKTPTTGTGVPW
tara:strand:- start:1386 stop:1712 length:327 start_codon:yes stop_codon:yes gene_type:complete